MTRRARSLIAAATVAALTFAACGGSDGNDDAPDDAEADDAQPPATQLEAEPEPADNASNNSIEESAGNQPTVDESEPDGGDGTSPEDAAPLVGETIELADDGNDWSLDLRGLADIASDDPADGACVALFGTATPTAIKNDDPWTSPFAHPGLALQVGGQIAEMSRDGCDSSEFANADYLEFRTMAAALGSPYNFVATFQLESGTVDDVEAVVIGNLDDSDATLRYHLPTIADGTAPATPPESDYSSLTVLPANAAPISIDSSDILEVQIQGIFPAPADEIESQDKGPGSCLIILGSMTATDTDGDLATASGPDTSILIGGHHLEARNLMCDTTNVEVAGYRSTPGIHLLPGASVDFYQAVFVPDALADAEVLIAIDDYPARIAQLMMPTLLHSLPSPLAIPDAHTVPPTSGPMTGTPISAQHRSDVSAFTMYPTGFFVGGLNELGNRRCVYFVATAVADSHPSLADSLNLLSSGQSHSTRTVGCDGASLEAAGYQRSNEVDFVAGIEVAVYEIFSVPLDEVDKIEALIVGDLRSREPMMFDPVFIDAIPPA